MILKLHICSICWKTKIIMILRVSCCEMKTWKTGRKLELLQKHNHLNKRHYDICTLNTCAFFERIKRITFTPTRNILHKSSYITFSLSCHTSHNLTIILTIFYLYSNNYSLLLVASFLLWNCFICPKQHKIIQFCIDQIKKKKGRRILRT